MPRWGISYGRAQLLRLSVVAFEKLCKDAFRVLAMSGYARIDVRLNSAGDPVFLEANANPDLAPRYFWDHGVMDAFDV
jgi:hypothetical protein